MEPKRSKYDTNPLDEQVADRAKQAFDQVSEGYPGPPTKEVRRGPTRDIGHIANEAARANPESELPTRRIDDSLAKSYPSVFAYQQPPTYQQPRVAPPNIYQPPPVPPPNVYQPPPRPLAQVGLPHTVAGLGIAEKWANMLPYIPGHIGAVAAVIELLLVPRSETRTRFHAAQGLALQVAILIVTGALQMVSLISGSSFGSGLFRAASTVFLIISMIRVWKGRPHHIAPLNDATKWLSDKINPRK